MQLNLIIKSGERRGLSFNLMETGSFSEPVHWLKENEAVEIILTTPKIFSEAVIELYDHQVETTYIREDDLTNSFIWSPKRRWNSSYDCLFFNYFGIAELSVSLRDSNGESCVINFQPIDILASKANALDVERMFGFLAKLDDDVIHSIFETTKHSAGFREGICTPNGNLERLELSTSKLFHLFQDIFTKPITKLAPENKVVYSTGEEALDDSSLAWLMSNLSELNETDDSFRAHIEYNSVLYKANSIQVSVLKENTDLYENQVLHGYVSFLITEAKKQLNFYNNGMLKQRAWNNPLPSGYASFYDQVRLFKDKLLSNQKTRCINVIDTLTKMKQHLELKVPVTRLLLQRPIMTQKSAARLSYRIVFIEFIDWFECSSPDWSVYKNLLAIQSIPKLFESFCFYKSCLLLNKIFNNNSKMKTFFTINDNVEVTLTREPKYWMPKHAKSIESLYVNSEGKTIKRDTFNERSHFSVNSHRCPDIVIEVKRNNHHRKLIVIDAKYQKEQKAFIESLKNCTMKYVHGIHYSNHDGNPVDSLTILHPCDDGSFNSYHSDEYSLFGTKPVKPSLQCVGMKLDDSMGKDYLEDVFSKLLISSGVDVDLLKGIPTLTS